MSFVPFYYYGATTPLRPLKIVFGFTVLWGAKTCGADVTNAAASNVSCNLKLTKYVLTVWIADIKIAMAFSRVNLQGFNRREGCLLGYRICWHYLLFQYWSGEKLTEVDRLNATHELFMYAIGIFIVVVVYAVYDVFELYITRKYQNSLDTPPEFIPVRHQEPPRPAGPKLSLDHPHFVQPPPPYNPQYH